MGEIVLYFYVPMERFFDETDQENSKKHERKNGGTKKKRFFLYYFFKNTDGRFPYSCVLHTVGNTLGLPPSGEPTRLVTSLMAMRC